MPYKTKSQEADGWFPFEVKPGEVECPGFVNIA